MLRAASAKTRKFASARVVNDLVSLARVLADEDEDDRRPGGGSSPSPSPLALWSWWTLGVLLIALVPRLIYLFAISNPENAGDGLYTDVYQQWQTSYLTKEICLLHAIRLCLINGVGFFLVRLHQIMKVHLFLVTGSNVILLTLYPTLAIGTI